MILENEIDAQILAMDNFSDENLDPFLVEQEEVLSYIKAEIAPSLLDEELKTLLFCFSVIYNSVRTHIEEEPDFDIETFHKFDEENWGVRDLNTGFEKSKDALFENYSQEDLLAFVEDIIANEEDENVLSEVGRELIFINSKSYIDTLCEVNIAS